jgi:hypothetical protein
MVINVFSAFWPGIREYKIMTNFFFKKTSAIHSSKTTNSAMSFILGAKR